MVCNKCGYVCILVLLGTPFVCTYICYSYSSYVDWLIVIVNMHIRCYCVFSRGPVQKTKVEMLDEMERYVRMQPNM